MTSSEEETITADFELSEWQATDYEVAGSNSQLARVRATKNFGGAITGSSVGDLLMAGNDIGAGFVASEVFVGSIGGREGSLIIQHWALAEGTEAASSGHIIPGSGTGELAGIGGKAEFSQDAGGQHRLRLRVHFS